MMSKTVRVSPDEIKMQMAPSETDEQQQAFEDLCKIVFTEGALVGRNDVRRLMPKCHPARVAHLIDALRANADALETDAMAQAMGMLDPPPPPKPPPELKSTRWVPYKGPKTVNAPARCPLTGEPAKGSYECPCCQNVVTIYVHDFKSSDAVYCSCCDHYHIMPAESVLS